VDRYLRLFEEMHVELLHAGFLSGKRFEPRTGDLKRGTSSEDVLSKSNWPSPASVLVQAGGAAHRTSVPF